MRSAASWRIATIRGVDLRIHISLLLVIAYLAFLISARFNFAALSAGINPARLTGSPILWGVVLAVSLFACVFIHEFGHVLVAQHQGVKVRGITLMMLGGVSEMEEMPERPYAEFRLAVIGPIVSFALAALFYGIKAWTTQPDLAFYSHWLASANLVLAIFNLVPAFPLDGGRALRSVLAARFGKVQGTLSAVRISKGLAWVLGILGLLSFNLLLALIAFFVYTAAQHERFIVLNRSLLQGLKVADVVVRIAPISGSASLRVTASQMLETRTTLLPVAVGQGETDGIITLARIRREPRATWDTTFARDLMQKTTKLIELNDPIGEILPELSIAPSGALPVHNQGEVIGLIRLADLNEVIEFRRFEKAA